jgi:hypothetical protein
MKSKALSILSNDLVVKGSIVSEGEVQLDGKSKAMSAPLPDHRRRSHGQGRGDQRETS